MNDLISRGAMIEQVCLNCELRNAGLCGKLGDVMGCLADEINKAPTVEVKPEIIHKPTKAEFKRMAAQLGYEPVRHGHWEKITDFGGENCFGFCSQCHTSQRVNNSSALIGGYRYCRWCGAKMDEVSRNEL